MSKVFADGRKPCSSMSMAHIATAMAALASSLGTLCVFFFGLDPLFTTG